VSDATVHLVNAFREYFQRHGEPIDENPSPGNKDGGITTLAEKSLGCVQKGGTLRDACARRPN
jgi:altronate hydrolase